MARQMMRWVFFVMLPVAVILSIWIPPIAGYLVVTAPPSAAVVERSRSIPTADLLRELGEAKHALIPPLGRLVEDPAAQADALLGIAGGTSQHRLAPFPFNPELLNDLGYASMGVPRVLLKAYSVTRDERYFRAARQFMNDWAEFDRTAWLPRGLLWNDHAIAARSITYSEYWRLFRQHSAYDAAEASDFLRLVATDTARLKDPKLYTHASNHGTMQNLALMHLGLAFPELEGFGGIVDLGISRQEEQYRYMMSPEGLVLEHSAGYHRLGMELLGIMLWYRTLQQAEIPRALIGGYRRARSVYSQFRAADGTLPPLGDTSIALLGPEPLTTEIDESGVAGALRRDAPWSDPDPVSVYPDGGNLIWWSSDKGGFAASQTTVSWAHFRRHGHKHADELAFNVRTGDNFWWRSSGYWPLGHALRGEAVSWRGSNAPHLSGESYGSERHARLSGLGHDAGLRFVELQRRGVQGFSVRRQLIHLPPGFWLTVDSFANVKGMQVDTVWTTGGGNTIVAQDGNGSYSIKPQNGDRHLQLRLFSQAPVRVTRIRAQYPPFGGWVEVGFKPLATDALLVETSPDQSWVANAFWLADGESAASAQDVVSAWSGPESWQFDIPVSGETFTLRRNGNLLYFNTDTGRAVRLTIDAQNAASSWQTQSAAHYEKASSRYGPVVESLIPWRLSMTKALLVLLLLQFAVTPLLIRYVRVPSWGVHAGGSIGWLSLAAWLHLVYFVT